MLRFILAMLLSMTIMSFALANSGNSSNGNNVVIDIASVGINVITPVGSVDSIPNGKFFGTVGHGRAYIWKGNSISSCNIGDVCGTNPSEYPGKLLGTAEWGLVIDNSQFDPALNAYFAGDIAQYVIQSDKITGVKVFTITYKLNFSGSADFNNLSADTLSLEGRTVWGVTGEISKFDIVGGTGAFANARKGVCSLERIILVNASGLETLRFICPRSVLVP